MMRRIGIRFISRYLYNFLHIYKFYSYKEFAFLIGIYTTFSGKEITKGG